MLLDEPLWALDAGLRERLAGDLREILRAAGTTALMVTHDHEEAFTVADGLAVMRAGRVVQRARSRRCGGPRPTPRRRSSSATPGSCGATRPGSARGSRAAARAGRRRTPFRAGGRRRRPAAGEVVRAGATPEQVRVVVDVTGLGRDRRRGAPRPAARPGGRRTAARGREPAGRAAGRLATGRAAIPRLTCVYRRAHILLIGIAAAMGVLAVLARCSSTSGSSTRTGSSASCARLPRWSARRSSSTSCRAPCGSPGSDPRRCPRSSATGCAPTGPGTA